MLNSMLQASTLCRGGALDTKSPPRLPAEVDLEDSLNIDRPLVGDLQGEGYDWKDPPHSLP